MKIEWRLYKVRNNIERVAGEQEKAFRNERPNSTHFSHVEYRFSHTHTQYKTAEKIVFREESERQGGVQEGSRADSALLRVSRVSITRMQFYTYIYYLNHIYDIYTIHVRYNILNCQNEIILKANLFNDNE